MDFSMSYRFEFRTENCGKRRNRKSTKQRTRFLTCRSLQEKTRIELKSGRELEADLIVMTTHGRGFFSHAILGSTTERVVRRAPCPVLVVREEHEG